jgi:hypothetical protein
MEPGASTGERLTATRHALLALHKLLLERERKAYLEDRGPLPTGGLFQLAMQDESFAWLRPVLQLVVQIDEMLEGPEPWTEAQAADLLGQTRALLRASEEGTPFERKYDEALQSDPEIVFAHRAVINAVNGRG